MATYDLKPAMSAEDVADGVCRAIETEAYAFVLVNFANPDMVGHTGVLPAAITAVDTIDHCIGRIIAARAAHDTAVVITADHGNCETMIDENGHPHTAHTTNPVPFIVADARYAGRPLQDRRAPVRRGTDGARAHGAAAARRNGRPLAPLIVARAFFDIFCARHATSPRFYEK